MAKRSIIIITSLLTLFVSHLSAQQILSLEECRNLAIKNNKSIQVASEQIKAAHYAKKDAVSNFYPKASFMGTYMRNEKNLNLIPSGLIPSVINVPILGPTDISGLRDKILKAGELKIKNVWAADFNVTQPIFMGGKIIAYSDICSYAQDLAKSMKDTKIVDVIVQVDEAYWQIVSVANKKRLAESFLKLMQKMDSDMQAMEDEGLVTKADRLSVSVKLNEAQMNFTKARNGLSLSKMLLTQLCGINISDSIQLQDENLTKLNINKPSVVVLPNIDEAIANRSEVKSLKLVSEIFKKKEKIAAAEFMPNMALSANYFWTNPNLFDGFQNNMGGMWNVGVVLKVPFNFVSSTAKLRQAKVEAHIKDLEMEDVKQKIKLQINQQAYKLREAGKKLKACEKNTEKADENCRYATVGFKEGVISAADAMAANTAWVAAHSDLIDAQIDLILCNVYLNKALGSKL